MKCPKCGAFSSVRETRTQLHGLRRRRHCDDLTCAHRFTTAEVIVPAGYSYGKKTRVLVIDERTIAKLRTAVADVDVLLGGAR